MQPGEGQGHGKKHPFPLYLLQEEAGQSAILADMRGQSRGLYRKEGGWGFLGLSKSRQINLGPAADSECHSILCTQDIAVIAFLPSAAG